MKVLIAGGCGFIGSHAVRHFVQCDDEVTVIDKLTYAGSLGNLIGMPKPFSFKHLDICDKAAMGWLFNDGGFDVVINFAAETHVDNSIVDDSAFIKTNFEGACNLMTLCRTYDKLYVHMSTDEVYGVAHDDHLRGFTVKDPLNPRNPYSATKAAADMMLSANKNTHNQDFLALRPSNNFGERQHEEKFLPKLIRCFVSQPDMRRTDFPLYGKGDQVREWTYAGDTAKAIRNAITNGRRGFMNVSSGVSMQNIEVIDRVKQILDSEGKLANPDAVTFVKDRPGHDRRYWIESSIASSEFTPFDEALRTTIEHYFQKFA